MQQEHILCTKDENLLVYKSSSGINSLSKHIPSSQKKKTTVSYSQTSIHQFYSSSKNKLSISDQVKQEVRVACAAFAALGY
ncbi:unnamed protein product [Rotaria sp. Silwood2]|nr:unnamed protein product [Rotaria sp. Silwood2]CAF3274371.1 unnamed protein product [Rotaria sp. Silwood2]CAF3977621.1 unnamed protein product [Rotaria sp. Silwood2]CAF4096421.1 unnamed protein product [Rotaria sp. Silwood2]